MFCTKCGKELFEEDSFCANCGTPVVNIKDAAILAPDASSISNNLETGKAQNKRKKYAMIVIGLLTTIILGVFYIAPKIYCDIGNSRKFDEYDLAVADFSMAIYLNPWYIEAYKGRAMCHRLNDLSDLAIADYSTVIRLDPKDAWAYDGRADLYYYNKNQYDLAIADYNTAILLEPDDPDHYDSRGEVYSKQGRHDLAISDYSKVIELYIAMFSAPEYKDYEDDMKNRRLNEHYHKRGLSYEAKGQNDLAIADFSKIISTIKYHEYNWGSTNETSKIDDAVSEAIKQRIDAYFKEQGRYNIPKMIEPINDYMPGYAYAYLERGEAYAAKNQFDLAIADYSKSIQIDTRGGFDKKNLRAYLGRGFSYTRTKQFSLAITDFDEVIKLLGLPEAEEHAMAYFFRGFSYSKLRQFDSAIADFNRAIQLNPRDADTYYWRGLTYGIKGQMRLAIADFRKALELNPLHEDARELLKLPAIPEASLNKTIM